MIGFHPRSVLKESDIGIACVFPSSSVTMIGEWFCIWGVESMDGVGNPSNDWLTYRELETVAPLREYVERSWILGTHSRSEKVVKRILPDGCLDFFLVGGGGLFLSGSVASYTLMTMNPGEVVVGVRFRWGMAPPLLGLPAEEVSGTAVPAEIVWPDDARRLAEEMLELETTETRLSALHVYLCDRVKHGRSRREPDRAIGHAAALLGASPLGIPVSSLADSLGLSERQLERRFLNSIGCSPKRFARVVRFQRLLALRREHRMHPDWAALALDAGYADQAHMINDVRELTGVTPTMLLEQ